MQLAGLILKSDELSRKLPISEHSTITTTKESSTFMCFSIEENKKTDEIIYHTGLSEGQF